MLKFSGYPYLIRGQRRWLASWMRAATPREAQCAAREGTVRRQCIWGESAHRGGTDAQHQAELEGVDDARTGMPHGIPRGAMCVQRFDVSLSSAIHTTYRISLRSSSMPEPRDPLLKVVTIVGIGTGNAGCKGVRTVPAAGCPTEGEREVLVDKDSVMCALKGSRSPTLPGLCPGAPCGRVAAWWSPGPRRLQSTPAKA